jgi:hypothetical protein
MSNQLNINFGLTDGPDGKKVPAVVFSQGALVSQVAVPGEHIEQVIEAFANGLRQAADAARIHNGSLIVPPVGPLPSNLRLNGS